MAALVSEGLLDCVVVNDEVSGPFVFVDVGGFAAAGWALDEDDAGFGCAPFFSVAVVCSSVVAGGAAGSEVVGVVPGAAGDDGGDVVDLGGVGGASVAVDLAGVVVSGEDLFADAGPWAAVGRFRHGFD